MQDGKYATSFAHDCTRRGFVVDARAVCVSFHTGMDGRVGQSHDDEQRHPTSRSTHDTSTAREKLTLVLHHTHSLSLKHFLWLWRLLCAAGSQYSWLLTRWHVPALPAIMAANGDAIRMFEARAVEAESRLAALEACLAGWWGAHYWRGS